jgi:hypothetical protein
MTISRSKYHAKKVTVNGETFDSKREYNRFCELSLLERAGTIADLQRQVKFVLIPAQHETVWNDKKKKYEKGKCIERECAYIADFVYTDLKTGFKTVEDVKSPATRTKDYIIKRKLMLWRNDIRIQEV